LLIKEIKKKNNKKNVVFNNFLNTYLKIFCACFTKSKLIPYPDITNG